MTGFLKSRFRDPSHGGGYRLHRRKGLRRLPRKTPAQGPATATKEDTRARACAGYLGTMATMGLRKRRRTSFRFEKGFDLPCSNMRVTFFTLFADLGINLASV
jgi:hypothetical protein